MKKKFRIRRSDEFQSIMRHKQFVVVGSVVVYTKHKKEEMARVGIAVSKKLGSAVVRNKAKRQLREIVRCLDVFNSDYDMIILVRDGFLKQSYMENQKDLEKALKKVFKKVKIECDGNVRSKK